MAHKNKLFLVVEPVKASTGQADKLLIQLGHQEKKKKSCCWALNYIHFMHLRSFQYNRPPTHRTQRVQCIQRVMIVLMSGPMFLSSTALLPSVKRLLSAPNIIDWSYISSTTSRWVKTALGIIPFPFLSACSTSQSSSIKMLFIV